MTMPRPTRGGSQPPALRRGGSRIPALARWLLRRLCATRHIEVAEGDITELFVARLRTQGRVRAVVRCFTDVASMARIGRAAPHPEPDPRSNSSGREAFVDSILHDLKFAARGLGRSPAFAVVVAATLALGIGANTTIFSVVNGVLLQPLPYYEPDRIVQIAEIDPTRDQDGGNMASQNLFLAWRERGATLSEIATYSNQSATLTGLEEPVRLTGAAVSPSLFGLLGVNAASGRTFTPEEQIPGDDNVVLLSSRAWQRYFGGDEGVVGRQLTIDDRSRTVVGVMAAGFDFPDPEVDYWVPMPAQRLGEGNQDALAAQTGRMVREEIRREQGAPAAAGGGGGAGPAPGPEAGPHIEIWGQVIGRLADGVDMAAAADEGTALVRGLREPAAGEPARRSSARNPMPVRPDAGQAGPEPSPEDEQPYVELVLLQDGLVGPVRSSLTLLMGAVGFVLLIACANVANLMLARSSGRARETAVRSALGAGRLRLVRMLLVEGLVLAGIGGALGLLLTVGGLRALRALGPEFIPRLENVALDGWTLAFTVAVSAATGVLFSLMPARGAASLDLSRALKQEAAGGGRALGGDVFRKVLVAAEVALSVILLVGAALLVSSFARLASVDPGYDPDNVLGVTLQMPQARYATPESYLTFFDQAIRALEQIPGVEGVTLASRPPTAEPNIRIALGVSRDPERPEEPPVAFGIRVVEPSYFELLRVSLVSGRGFNDDDRAGGAPVAVVNESAARAIFPDEDPVGRAFPFMGGQELEIVGVVADARTAGVDPQASPEVFLPLGQAPARMIPGLFRSAGFLIRTDPAPLSVLPAVRTRVTQLDAEVPLFRAATLRDQISASVAEPRFYAALVSAFAALAVVLATVGIYGLLSYSVQQGGRETAIRRALGARSGEILARVVRQGMALALVGLAIGMAGALSLTRLLESMLYEIEPTDPLTLTLAATLFLLVALVAIWIPARRATRIDPMEALRYEG